MSRNIYQELWDLDIQPGNNGCTVTARGPDGQWLNSNADIKLDEQNELTSGGSDDAPNPLIADFNADKLQGKTYLALKALMNNYVFNARQSEDHLGDNAVEDTEIEIFMDKIQDTPVMQMAFDYINADLGANIDAAEFRAVTKRLWFDIYTNHYNNNPVPFCSGFEHIVVGESKGNPNDRGIGGYHSWTKYLFDQQSGRVNFNGFNYDNKLNKLSPEGASVPHVATVSLTYEPLDMDGQPMGRKRKNLGGFFVGPSPECQIVMPVVAYYESINGRFFVASGNTPREQTEKEVHIHDAVYRLVLYMETRQDQTRGDRLRSFYPKFEQLKSGSSIEPGQDDTQGIIAIVAMLANPAGPEKGNEWVEIENRSDEIINLDSFQLVDHKNRPELLSMNIEPRQRLRIMVSRSTPNSMQLTNSGGTVSVINATGGLITKVTYPESRNGEVLFFT